MRRSLSTIASGMLLLCSTTSAWAHREDYLDETLVYQTLERGKIEPEYWLDVGSESDKASNDRARFFRHSVALEYGITDRWMVDGRASIKDSQHENVNFESGRLETRYRFFEEGTEPVDVAVSAEVHTERNDAGKQEPAIEPRLIVSKDVGALNCTLNLPEEISLRSGELAFVPSFGIRYNATGWLRLGSEFKYNTHTHQDSVVPQLWFVFPHDITLKLGYSWGLNRNEERFARVAVEVEF